MPPSRHSSRAVTLGLFCGGLLFGSCQVRPPGGPPDSLGPVVAMPELDGADACGPESIPSLLQCVEQARLSRDVARIVELGAADPSAESVAALCRERFGELGYQVSEQRYDGGVNVIARRGGVTRSAEQVVLGAHYDHLAGCPGADDNASGVAAVFELARVLAEARFDRTLVLACWDGGEAAQEGSAAFAERAHAGGEQIRVAFALEAIGYADHTPNSQRLPERFEERFPDQALTLLDNDYRADFLTVVVDQPALPWAQALVRYAARLPLPVQVLSLTPRMKAKLDADHRSDQASLWDEGFAALLLTDSGPYRNPRIHCHEGDDTPDSLDYHFAAKVARAALGAVAEALELR